MSIFREKPARFFQLIVPNEANTELDNAFCAGFENEKWRCDQMAIHLLEWLPEYALTSDLLKTFTHVNALNRIRQAAQRIYTTEKYENRGEVGEITAHAICRDFFNTYPIAPRIHYKSSSNDVIKGFDLVHARIVDEQVEIWLGEAKTYQNNSDAIADAISSVRSHLDQGFLKSQKLLLGPQLPPDIPQRDKLISLFEANTSLDKLISSAIFPIIILAESNAIKQCRNQQYPYPDILKKELNLLSDSISKSNLRTQIKVPLIYVPLQSKKSLLSAFDTRLKGLQ